MNYRFDQRSKDTFKKDIKFSTMLEKFFFDNWLEVCDQNDDIHVSNPKNNGCDNNGEFIEKGRTSGADYMVDIEYHDYKQESKPLEMKWVPTFGKFTLKEGDVKAYLKEGADILFIYNVKKNLKIRKPLDYNLERHIAKIKSEAELRWGILINDRLKDVYDYHKLNNLVKPIPYMGYKPGFVIKEKDFDTWFIQEKWIW